MSDFMDNKLYYACNVCKSSGTLYLTREELYSLLRDDWTYSLRDKIDIIKEWLDTGEIDCFECDAKGYFVSYF